MPSCECDVHRSAILAVISPGTIPFAQYLSSTKVWASVELELNPKPHFTFRVLV